MDPSSLEAEAAFRVSLTEVMAVGLRWGGGTAMLGAAVHLGIAGLVRGEAVRWTYSAVGAHEVAALYHAVVFAIGAGLVALSVVRCPLSVGRGVVAGAALVATGASMHDDLLRGTPVAVEFVIMIYMVVVVTVPFRPWQALGVGGGILGVYGVLTGPEWWVPASVPADATGPSLTIAVLLGTAVSTVLYATRLTQHRVRRAARDRLAAAKDRAERALETVEHQAEELRALDAAKSRFFADVSHELRTPLTLLLSPLRTLIKEDGRSAEEQQILETAHQNAERLERLSDQLMNLARHDAGRLSLREARRHWGRFVEAAVQRFAPMAESHAVDLTVETEAADGPVRLDPDHMETVLANLIRNALMHTPAGGTVAVRARRKTSTALVTVADTGPGISADEHDAVFERFQRGTNASRWGGTGIGLALARALVSLHDGTISVESAPEEGSTFTVRWPGGARAPDYAHDERAGEAHGESSRPRPAPQPSDTADTKDAPAAPPEDPDRTTVLVVEDHDSVRAYVRHLLESTYRVLEAENGRRGLKQARTALPDLVVADVVMPEMNGVDMLDALRRRPRTEGIPVVMLTGRAEAADQVEGLEAGADAYVTKPFDAEVLTAQVHSIIATRQQLQERYREADMPGAAPPDGDAPESSFEAHVRETISAHLTDADFTVQQLADEVGYTRRTVTRRVKEAFGHPPSALIRTIRLEHGAHLLEQTNETISEVAYAVGFNSLSYFSRRFKEHFGVSPSGYRREREERGA